MKSIINILSRSFKIGKLFQVPIHLHSTLLLIPLIFLFSHINSSDLLFKLGEFIFHFSFILFFVLLHEFGHILMARKFLYPTSFVILSPIGGIAFIRLPIYILPYQEFWITFAGPLVNFILALFFLPFTVLFPDFKLIEFFFYSNLILGCFNLLPIFPMDGGRIFRSLLQIIFKIGIYLATKICVTVTIIIGIFFIIPAIAVGNITFVLIIIFMLYMANLELTALEKFEQF